MTEITSSVIGSPRPLEGIDFVHAKMDEQHSGMTKREKRRYAKNLQKEHDGNVGKFVQLGINPQQQEFQKAIHGFNDFKQNLDDSEVPTGVPKQNFLSQKMVEYLSEYVADVAEVHSYTKEQTVNFRRQLLGPASYYASIVDSETDREDFAAKLNESRDLLDIKPLADSSEHDSPKKQSSLRRRGAAWLGAYADGLSKSVRAQYPPEMYEAGSQDSDLAIHGGKRRKERRTIDKKFDGLVGEIAGTGFKVDYLETAAQRYHERAAALNPHEFNEKHPISTAKREIVGSMLAAYINTQADYKQLSVEAKDAYRAKLINTFTAYGELSDDERSEVNELVVQSRSLEGQLGEKKEKGAFGRYIRRLGRGAFIGLQNTGHAVDSSSLMLAGIDAPHEASEENGSSSAATQKKKDGKQGLFTRARSADPIVWPAFPDVLKGASAHPGESIEEYQQRNGIKDFEVTPLGDTGDAAVAAEVGTIRSKREVLRDVGKSFIFNVTPGQLAGHARSVGEIARKHPRFAFGVLAVGAVAAYLLIKDSGGHHGNMNMFADLQDKLQDTKHHLANANDYISQLEMRVDTKQEKINHLRELLADQKRTGGVDPNAVSWNFSDGSGGEAFARTNGFDPSLWYKHQDAFAKAFPDLTYRMGDGNIGLIDQSTTTSTSTLPRAAQEWWQNRVN